MSAPNPDDPLAEHVAKHWKENEPEAIATGALPGKGRACCAHSVPVALRASPRVSSESHHPLHTLISPSA